MNIRHVIILLFGLSIPTVVLGQNKDVETLKSEVQNLKQQAKAADEDARAIMESYEKSLKISDNKIADLSRMLREKSDGTEAGRMEDLKRCRAETTALKMQLESLRSDYAAEKDRLVKTLDAQVRQRVEAEEARTKLSTTHQQKLGEMRTQEEKRRADLQKQLDQQIQERLTAEQAAIAAQENLKEQLRKSNGRLEELASQVDMLTKQLEGKPEGTPANPKDLAMMQAEAKRLQALLEQERKQSASDLVAEQKRNQDLTGQVQSMQQELRTAMSAKSDSTVTSKAAKQQLLELQRELEGLRKNRAAELPPDWKNVVEIKGDLAEAQATVAQQRSRLKSLENERDNLRQNLNNMSSISAQATEFAQLAATLRAKNGDLTVRLGDLQATYDELKKQNAELRSAYDTNADTFIALRDAHEEMLDGSQTDKKTIKDSSIALLTARKDLDLAQKKVEELQRNVMSTEQKHLAKTGEASRYQSQIARIEAELENVETSNEVMQVKLSNTSTQLAQREQSLMDMRKLMQGKVSDSDVEVNRLRTLSHSNELRSVELASELAKRDDRITALMRAVEESKQVQLQLAKFRADLVDRDKELLVLRPFKATYPKIQDELTTLREDLLTLTARNQEAETKLRAEKDTVAATMARLGEAKEQQFRSEKDKLDQIVEIESELAGQAVTISELRGLNEEKQKQLDLSNQELNNLKTLHEKTRTNLESAEKTNVVVSADRRRFEDALKRSETELQQVKRDMSLASASVSESESTLKQLETRNNMLGAQLREASLALTNALETVVSLDEERSEREKTTIQLAMAKGEIKELEEDVSRTRSEEILKKNSELADIKREMAEMFKAHRSTEERLQQQNTQLSKAVSDARQQYSAASQRLKDLDATELRLKAELAQSQATSVGLSSSTNVIQSLEQMLSKTRDDLAQTKLEVTQLKSRNTDLTGSVDANKELQRDLQMSDESYALNLQRLTRARDDLQVRLATLEKRSQSTEKRLIETSDENLRLDKELRESQTKVVDLLQQQHRIISQLRRLLGTDAIEVPAP